MLTINLENFYRKNIDQPLIPNRKRWQKFGAIVLTTALINACGGGSSSSDEQDHSDTAIDTAGRLAIYNQDDNAVHIWDLDTNTALDSFPLIGGAPLLYSSPDHRYAVVVQRADNQVSFIDSGLYTEDHGDHLHDYAENPRALEFTLEGSRPTHYTHYEHTAVVFFDGETGVNSSVQIFSDSSIGAGTLVAELVLDNNMHGVAKLIDDQLFVTYRDASITDTTLPSAVERYQLSGSELTLQERYEEACPLLHGSAVTDEFITFGCSDGVLAIDLSADDYVAFKLPNPESLLAGNRIGTLVSHDAVDHFVGIAGNQFFVIDANSPLDAYQELTLPEGVSRIAYGFNVDGHIFYILGNDGILYLYEVDADWNALTPVMVTDAVEEGDSNPAITVSAAEDRLFVLNTNGQQIIEVSSEDGAVIRTIDLGFTATRLVWLGLAESHDHSHNE
jgi:WD40 repeat protein